jgi:hypothetical protein
MSQTDKKRRRLASSIGESFAAIRRRTARSKAWLSLSAPAIKIYIELRLRWRHKHNNNGELFLSIAECKSLLGIPPGTAHRAFRELQEKGFIVMTRKGEAGKLNTAVLENGGCGYSRRATTWALTDEPYRGQPATHAYEQWEPPPKNRFVLPPVERRRFHQWNVRWPMVPIVERTAPTFDPRIVPPMEYLYLPSMGRVPTRCRGRV